MKIIEMNMVSLDILYTAGNSLLAVVYDCFMVVGGCNKIFLLYTPKLTKLNPCDLQEKWVIIESWEIFPHILGTVTEKMLKVVAAIFYRCFL